MKKSRNDYPVGTLCHYRNTRNTSDFFQVVRVEKWLGPERDGKLTWCVAVRSTTSTAIAFACALDELEIVPEGRNLCEVAHEIQRKGE